MVKDLPFYSSFGRFKRGIIFLIIRLMISFSVYNILPPDMQADMLLSSGVYLELVRQTPRLNIELYALHNFYVEVYLDKSTEDTVLLRAFDSLKELELYSHLIGINNIF